MALKDVSGKIVQITVPVAKTLMAKTGVNAGSTFTTFNLGVKIQTDKEEVWCNAQASSEAKVLEYLNCIALNGEKRTFKVGADCKIYLESDKSGQYWKIKSITPLNDTAPVKEEVIQDKPITTDLNADKIELGQARNNAMMIVTTVLSHSLDDINSPEKAKETINKSLDEWERLTIEIFERGKKIRKAKLGY